MEADRERRRSRDRRRGDPVTGRAPVAESGPMATMRLADRAGGRARPAKAEQLFHEGNKCVPRGRLCRGRRRLTSKWSSSIRADAERALNNSRSGVLHSWVATKRRNSAFAGDAQSSQITPTAPWQSRQSRCASKGDLAEAEACLRRALKLNPKYPGARSNLGYTLSFIGRLREAKGCFPQGAEDSTRAMRSALLGMGQLAALRVASTKRRRCSSAPWRSIRRCRGLGGAGQPAQDDRPPMRLAQGGRGDRGSGIAPWEEAELRFAIGKYFDDVERFRAGLRRTTSAATSC